MITLSGGDFGGEQVMDILPEGELFEYGGVLYRVEPDNIAVFVGPAN